METITCIEDLARNLDTTVDRLKRDMFKYTECGAWITWDDRGVSVGSIVEGSDAEFSNTFTFPFFMRDFESWIDELEMLCDEAWHEANDEPDDESERSLQ